MSAGIAILAVFVVVLLLIGVWAVLGHRRLAGLRTRVQEAWRQIDVELNRRHDLIPNLVETVRTYAGQERVALDAVATARAVAIAPGASIGQQAQQEDELSQAVGRLLAVTESYPELRASQNYVALQAELGRIDDRIGTGRALYNGAARELNARVESPPSNILAGFGHFHRADYFEVETVRVGQAPAVGVSGEPGYGSASS